MDIEVLDLKRLFIGDEPPLFLFEIVFRTGLIYAYALLLLRWLGSRTIGQLSTVEFLLVIALGSAVGDGMFYPDVPLLHAMLVVTLVVLANKGLDLLIARSAAVERAVDGVPEEVIRDGVIRKSYLANPTLSTGELFQQLREEGVRHLGQVQHAYMETDGVLTVFRGDAERPGLPIVPPWEIEPPREIDATHGHMEGTFACLSCGYVHEGSSEALTSCPACAGKKWTELKA